MQPRLGQARLDPETPASAAMRYSIGSVSKQFTAAAILLLVIAALAFLGFSGDAIDDLKSTIPVLGGLLVGFGPRGS